MQCINCNDIVETKGEMYCCDDCCDEWHDLNPDYEWDQDKNLYVTK